MATYQTKIEDLIGSVGDTTAISDFCTDTARDIINTAPSDILNVMAEEIDDSGSGATLNNAKFLYAKKSGYEASRVNANKTARYTDSNSIYLATVQNPICYIEKNKVFVKPSGGQVFAVKFPTIAYGDSFGSYASSGTVVAQELEPAILLGAAVKGRLRQLADKRTSLPVGLVYPPTPLVPSLSANQIGTMPTAPAYTAPKVGGETEELTAAITTGAIGDSTDQLDVSKWWDVLADMIETDEDPELASAQLQKITSYVNTYSQAMQNQMNLYNKTNSVYQGELQKLVENARLSSQDDSQLLQKYQAEIQNYSNELNAQVQSYTTDLQRFSQEHSLMLQELQVLQAQYMQALQGIQKS
tara:strand:- start:1691 stop:2761 length:1071 start_codon:yes stop_codon:yes gene_type:complete